MPYKWQTCISHSPISGRQHGQVPVKASGSQTAHFPPRLPMGKRGGNSLGPLLQGHSSHSWGLQASFPWPQRPPVSPATQGCVCPRLLPLYSSTCWNSSSPLPAATETWDLPRSLSLDTHSLPVVNDTRNIFAGSPRASTCAGIHTAQSAQSAHTWPGTKEAEFSVSLITSRSFQSGRQGVSTSRDRKFQGVQIAERGCIWGGVKKMKKMGRVRWKHVGSRDCWLLKCFKNKWHEKSSNWRDAVMVVTWLCSYALVKAHRMYNTKSDYWLTIMYQYGLINCSQCTTLMEDINPRGSWW